MKKLIVLFVIATFFINFDLFSQRKKIENLPNFDKKPWNFGYYLGVNQNSYVLTYKPSVFTNATVTVEESMGFNIGVIFERRLHKNLTARFEPGLMSNVKKLYFKNDNGSFLEEKDFLREVPTTYFHMPLLLKFSTDRLRNVKGFIIGGLALDYNFSSNEKNSDDNNFGEFRTKTINYMYELGIGIDFYTPYFKFSPSLRGVFAINNELVPDNVDAASPWTAPIDKLSTRGVFVKFTFE